MLAEAQTPDERFKGLLLYTNMSAQAVDGIDRVARKMRGLPTETPGMRKAIAWGNHAIHEVFGDTGVYEAEQRKLAAEIGAARAEALLAEATALLDNVT